MKVGEKECAITDLLIFFNEEFEPFSSLAGVFFFFGDIKVFLRDCF